MRVRYFAIRFFTTSIFCDFDICYDFDILFSDRYFVRDPLKVVYHCSLCLLYTNVYIGMHIHIPLNSLTCINFYSHVKFGTNE